MVLLDPTCDYWPGPVVDPMQVDLAKCSEEMLRGESDWGRWSFDPGVFTLNHTGGYQVGLLRLDDDRDFVSCVGHLTTQYHFDAEDLGNFVLAVTELWNWQTHRPLGPLFRILSADELKSPLPPPMRDHELNRKGVYLISDGRACKIGRADNIARRRRELQTGNSAALDVLAILSPDPNREGYWHQRFSHLRLRNEWFKLGEQVAAHIRYEREFWR